MRLSSIGFIFVAVFCVFSGCSFSENTLPRTTNSSPKMVLQFGHGGAVKALAFSPDGKTMASAGDDKVIRLSDANSGDLKETLSGNRAAVRLLEYSPNGAYLASINGSEAFDYDNELVLFDLVNRKVIRTWSTRNENNFSYPITACAFSPDGKTLALASWESGETEQSQITLWEIATGKQQGTTATLKQKVRTLAFSRDGKSIAAGRENEYAGRRENAIANIWDVTTGELKRTFKSDGTRYPRLNDDGFHDIAFTPDGKTLAASNIFGEEMGGVTVVWLWDTQTGKLKRTLEVLGFGTNLSISNDGKTLVSSGGMWGTGSIVFWDVETGKKKRVIEGVCALFPLFALSPDGKKLATNAFYPKEQVADISDAESPFNSLQLWDASTGKVVRTIRGHEQMPVRAIAIAADGSRFASINSARGQQPKLPVKNLRFWSTRTGRLQTTLQGDDPIAFSSDGKMLVSNDSVPRANKKVPSKELNSYWGEYTHGDAASPNFDAVIALRNSATGKLLRTIKAAPYSIAISSTGKMLAAQSYGGINPGKAAAGNLSALRIWDLSSGKLRHVLRGFPSTTSVPIAFSPNGLFLASANHPQDAANSAVQLWNTQTGKLKLIFKAKESSKSEPTGKISSIVFSPDGKNIIGRSVSGIFFWDIKTGKRLRTIETTGFVDDISPMAISYDGKFLATETDDNSIILWNTQNGEPLRELKGHQSGVLSLAFSPGSKTLVSGSNDGSIKVWNAQTGELILTTISIGVTKSKMGMSTDWISFTPDGHYDGSAGIERFICWRVGDELFPAEKLKAEKHRPDLIVQALAAPR